MPRANKPASASNPVAIVLENLGRTRRRVARQSRHGIENLVSQAIRAAMEDVATNGTDREYNFDELARRANVSSRNLRSYREKGLLPPPRRAGRVARFNDEHVARLALITTMLERGYTISLVRELITAWEDGKTLGAVLGLPDRGPRPTVADPPRVMSTAEFVRLMGGESDIDRVAALGLVLVDGEECRVSRPRLLNALGELRKYGVEIDEMLDVHEDVASRLTTISENLVETGARLLSRSLTDSAHLETLEQSGLIQLLVRLRDIVVDSVAATFAESLDATLGSILEDLLPGPADTDEPAATTSES